jgi:hypothetical protein
MANNVAYKTLSLKRRSPLSAVEAQQVECLRKLYGTYNFIMAVRYSKSGSLREIGLLLMQIAGFQVTVDPCLKGIVINHKEAFQKLGPSKIQIADRLREATKTTYPEQFINLFRIKTGELPISAWKGKTYQEIVQSPLFIPIKSAITKYGIDLTHHALQVLSVRNANVGIEDFVFFKIWIETAAQRDWIELEKITKEAGIKDTHILWGIPHPCPMRLLRYFQAKTGRDPSEQELESLWKYQLEYGIDPVIFAMSCIPLNRQTMEEFLDKILEIKFGKNSYEYRSDRGGGTMSDYLGGKKEDEEEDDDVGMDSEVNNNPGLDDEDYVNAWTISDRLYDYSNYDEGSLESEERPEFYEED